ncbi:MAG: hypothetical protein AAGJ94_11825 [Pseudomonadota bacterium]
MLVCIMLSIKQSGAADDGARLETSGALLIGALRLVVLRMGRAAHCRAGHWAGCEMVTTVRLTP